MFTHVHIHVLTIYLRNVKKCQGQSVIGNRLCCTTARFNFVTCYILIRYEYCSNTLTYPFLLFLKEKNEKIIAPCIVNLISEVEIHVQRTGQDNLSPHFIDVNVICIVKKTTGRYVFLGEGPLQQPVKFQM